MAVFRAFSLLLTLLVSWSVDLMAAEANAFTDLLRPTFRQSCVKCHGRNGKVKGKVNLFALQSAADLTKKPKLMQKLIEMLDANKMPPEKEPTLAPKIRAQLVVQLRGLLNATIASRGMFSQAPIRRMNRFQYSNAVQDLLRLNVDVFALPERMLREHGNYFRPETGKMPNNLKVGSRPLGKSQLVGRRLAGVAPFLQDLRAEHGFDNRGDHLSLSPLLLESFFKLSRAIVESPDFSRKTCGIWQTFFAPPPGKESTQDAVRERLRGFLTRAFRRSVDDTTLARYAGHVMARIQAGNSFADGMKAAAAAALASPRFLYLYDRASTGDGAKRLDNFELASRLSFFLWGSIPDQTLLDLAADGRLRDRAVLSRQLDRMLNDRRVKRFCDSFPAQWLQLERIISSLPDEKRFPKFYFGKYRASMHMMLEPLLLFETILVENRSILELIDSKFSYRSKLLESWYKNGQAGAGPPTAIAFRRVPIQDRRQGGVITTVAVMTMTSNAVRTQPITRGAWMATVIFNDPPKPPPADVPPLPEEDAAETEKRTLRERLDAHRTRADCKGCHAEIDPLGFALENYGPTGIWRDKYENGRSVDASGVLFRKHKFANIVEFKDAILTEKDRFAKAFASHMLSFALAREVSLADSPALDRIVRESAGANYPIRLLIKKIVLSEPFLHKLNPSGPEEKEQ